MANVKIYTAQIEACNDCPMCNAFSVDCVAHARCGEAGRDLPADGKKGTEIMYMEIPEWCPLPDEVQQGKDGNNGKTS